MVCVKIFFTCFVNKKLQRYPVTDPKAHKGGTGIALLFVDLGARTGWVVSTTARQLYPRKKPGTHCTGGWVGPRAGLDVCPPIGIRSPDRPVRSQSLYRLSYPSPLLILFFKLHCVCIFAFWTPYVNSLLLVEQSTGVKDSN
jgi:hypothetical protein